MSKRYRYLTPADYEVAKSNGIGKATLATRVYRGMDIDLAITKPVQEQVNNIKKWIPLAKMNGIKESTLRGRVDIGWEMELAATKPSTKLKKG